MGFCEVSHISVCFQLYTRITKQGWFDSNKDVYIFRGVIDDVNQFLAVCVIDCFLFIYLNYKINVTSRQSPIVGISMTGE